MKANVNTVIVGSRVVLVPYQVHHVPKYHEWMLSEELRALTASEPLSLEEEYEMQEKWQLDEDKLTFIVLARGSVPLPEAAGEIVPSDPRLRELPMVGDVNIFLYGAPPTPGIPLANDDSEEEDFYAEVEIMIAEPAYRRKGLALEALQLMLGYATCQPRAFSVAGVRVPLAHTHTFADSPLSIPPASLVTKISDTNDASIRLFEKLGFEITKRVEVFHEVEMRYKARSLV